MLPVTLDHSYMPQTQENAPTLTQSGQYSIDVPPEPEEWKPESI